MSYYDYRIARSRTQERLPDWERLAPTGSMAVEMERVREAGDAAVRQLRQGVPVRGHGTISAWCPGCGLTLLDGVAEEECRGVRFRCETCGTLSMLPAALG